MFSCHSTSDLSRQDILATSVICMGIGELVNIGIAFTYKQPLSQCWFLRNKNNKLLLDENFRLIQNDKLTKTKLRQRYT